MTNPVHFQTPLENQIVKLEPLSSTDFEALFSVACDPLIWEQHPNKNRYQREVFQNYFEGALASKGAYLIRDVTSNEVAGCSRYYDHDEVNSGVFIGYTFFARKHWGTGLNPSAKHLMLTHAFECVDSVYFHVGIQNQRSQIAMERLGAEKIREVEVAYYGEPSRINIEYVIHKKSYLT